MTKLALALAVLFGLWGAAPARAQQGAHGRLDGDLVLEGALGGGATFEGEAISAAATLELRARYLDSGGLVLAGEWRPDGASRVLLMVDFRPLFLARFLLGGSGSDRYWDMFVDSIGLDLGVAFAPLGEGFGAALAVGFGVDVPLVFFEPGGMSLRLYGRHVAALASDRLGPTGGLNDWIAGGALVFRGQVSTGLPAWAPPRYEVREEAR